MTDPSIRPSSETASAAQSASIAALRRIAGELLIPRVSYAVYVEHRHDSDPSPSTVIRAFGSWRAAGESAGLATNRYSKGGESSYDSAAALAVLAQCARDYAAETGRDPLLVTQRFYSQWRAGRSEATCAALTLANRYGSWRRAKGLALAPDSARTPAAERRK